MDLPADDDGPDFGEIVQYGNELEPLPELNTPSPQENTAESPQEDTEDTLPPTRLPTRIAVFMF